MKKNLLENLVNTELPNAMQIWTNVVPETNRVSLRLMIMVGSAHQSIDQLGLAHFVEHLALNFSNPKNGAEKYYNQIIQSGGSVNAFTAQECTSFVADFPCSQLDNCIELIKSCILHPDFSEEIIKTEKGVILDELVNYRDNPFWSEVYYQIFGNQAFTYDGVGVEGTIKKFKKKEVEGFFKKHYVSNKMNLICVGNFDPEYLKQLVVDKFEGFSSNNENWEDYEYRSPKLHQVRVGDYDLSHSIYFGYRVCGLLNYSKDYLTLWFIRDYMQENLFDFVRGKGYLYGINVIYHPFRYAGLFLVTVPYIKKGRREVLKQVKKEFQSIATGVIEKNKFEETQKTLVNQFTAFLDDYRRLAEEYELHVCSHKKGTEFTDIIGEIKRLTAQDVVTTASKYFKKENHFTIKNHITYTAWGWISIAVCAVWGFVFFKKHMPKWPALYIEYSPIICIFLVLVIIWLLIDRQKLSRLK